ncbi:MAG TPA: class I SAM-dependent methyltransferase [Dissulfurispiraceae bacterium]|nr:class I SAM-dependent methyltransferase [Dissulfurispiraceae bacterium]
MAIDNPNQYDVNENQSFWKRVNPEGYLHATPERGAKLIELFNELGIEPSASILELGCNCGRNLAALWDAGYHNLVGVEINPKAVRVMNANYGQSRPVLAANMHCSSIEDYTKAQDQAGVQFDVIYTMAVLFHMHPDSEWCYENIANMTGRYLITIECERSQKPPRHYARKYKAIFEGYGLKQVLERKGFADLQDYRYTVRVFERC